MGMLPKRLFELMSIEISEVQPPMERGMVPVRLAPEMVRFWRNLREERLEGKGRPMSMD